MKKTLKIGSDGGWQVGFWRICIGEQMVMVDRGPITELLTFLSHWFQPISFTLRDLSLNSAIIKPLIKLICPILQTRFCSEIAPTLVIVTRLPNLSTCSAVSPNLFKRRSRLSLFLPTPLQKGPICIYKASWFAYISPSSCLAIGSPTICTNRLPVFSELVKFQMELFTSQCCRVEALFPSSICPQYQSSWTRIASTRSVFAKRPPEYTKFATYFL